MTYTEACRYVINHQRSVRLPEWPIGRYVDVMDIGHTTLQLYNLYIDGSHDRVPYIPTNEERESDKWELTPLCVYADNKSLLQENPIVMSKTPFDSASPEKFRSFYEDRGYFVTSHTRQLQAMRHCGRNTLSIWSNGDLYICNTLGPSEYNGFLIDKFYTFGEANQTAEAIAKALGWNPAQK